MFKKILVLISLALALSANSCGQKEAVAETTIKLSTMQCESCEATITKALQSVEGVSFVSVDAGKKEVKVKFDGSKTDLAKLETAITKAGYDANDKAKDEAAYTNLPDCCKIP
ncbi:heavy-metal-associated domain-containing protein [bacterium]|nr:heavy-metal-associated domain-containing protein [bacterium]